VDKETALDAGFDQDVGANIQRYRAARGMSQSELADRLSEGGEKVHQQTVQKIEKGTRPLRFSEAIRIASILELPTSELTNPSPTSAANARMNERLIRVSHASEVVKQGVAKLAEELLKLAVTYGRSTVAEPKPSGVLLGKARYQLHLDWGARLGEDILAALQDPTRESSMAAKSTAEALNDVVERASQYDGSLGIVVDNAIRGLDDAPNT
jgi:transcriptional regulator with XRE-family HTH domain